jgi:hypothetical protein
MAPLMQAIYSKFLCMSGSGAKRLCVFLGAYREPPGWSSMCSDVELRVLLPFGLPCEFSSFVAWLVPRCFAGVPLLNVLQEGRREVLAVWRKYARPAIGCRQSADDLAANE